MSHLEGKMSFAAANRHDIISQIFDFGRSSGKDWGYGEAADPKSAETR
jgi:hypothetical protein